MRLANVISCVRFAVVAVLLAATGVAHAGNPRWISGPPFFTNWGVMVAWYTNHPMYYTDAGDLSANVNHAAADAMVAQAASVWNVPTASLVLAQGGSLNEHVSGANVYANASGLVFPADVQASNYGSKQIAVIYDTDGSVTDMLLGSGASDPTGCLQGGVTESVDSFSQQGQILHAVLILNGKCTGPQPEKQLQMQYQLMRAFGRILGLGWSQTNDNVFTGSPAPTQSQALNWPIMHPIDITCGLYTYQCLPQPFTLRPDDISSLEMLYFVQTNQVPAGKQASWSNAGGALGYVTFPNGQGMEGVNVVVKRRAPFWSTAEDWQTASSVSGYAFRGQSSTSVAAAGTSAGASMGQPGVNWGGFWRIQSIPVPASQAWTDLVVSTEPVNPLYSGPYAIGPQVGDTMSPSGSPQVQVSQYLANGRDQTVNFTPGDAVSTCTAQADGTEGAPASVAQQGWWTGTLCGYQHQAWSTVQVKANRSMTIEVTPLDEQGQVTLLKAMPVIGAWKSTDATGTLPTVAAAANAFNAIAVGVTALHLQSSAAAAASFRVDVADQRGAGRPDFAYQARALYADSISPANVQADGGSITITGMGFRDGVAVMVNGVAATVTSSTATTIVATLPSLHVLGLSRATVTSITVKDPSTGGTSVMTNALSYASPVEALTLLSAPTGSVPSGTVAPTSFSVKAIAPDGFTPIVGESVSFTAAGAGASLSPCAAATCTVLTNAAGIAAVPVMPTAQGTVSLLATGRSGTASASFTATPGDVLRLTSAPAGIATTGVAASTMLRAQLLSADGTTPRAGLTITLTTVAGASRFGACATVPCSLTTDATGTVATSVIPTSTGTITVQLASAASAVMASFSAAPESIQTTGAPANAEMVGMVSATAFGIRVVAGDGVTPVAGEAVVFSATGAAVSFGACGGAVCTLTTNAQGTVQSSVLPTAAGPVVLSAVANAGSVTSSFAAAARVQSISVARPVQYVAQGFGVTLHPRATLADNGASTANVAVTWTSSKSLTFAASSSTTDASGSAVGVAMVEALDAGVLTQGAVCAWTNVCTPVAVQGVGQNDWRIMVVSGGAQSTSNTGSLGVVTIRVTNLNGDPVAGVPVQIEQKVSEWQADCTSGRCPVAATLATTASAATSDIDGMVTITPAQVGDAAATTQIAAIAGTGGFATVSLEKHP